MPNLSFKKKICITVILKSIYKVKLSNTKGTLVSIQQIGDQMHVCN